MNFKVWGRGIVEDGVRLGDEVWFKVDADAQCTSSPDVSVFDRCKFRVVFILKCCFDLVSDTLCYPLLLF